MQMMLTMEHRTEDIGKHMAHTHGDFAGGDGNAPQALGQMRAVAFENCSAKRAPEESFGDIGVGGVEGMEVGVRLPFFEQEFHLPTQPIGVTDLRQGELLAGQVGEEIAWVTTKRASRQSQATSRSSCLCLETRGLMAFRGWFWNRLSSGPSLV